MSQETGHINLAVPRNITVAYVTDSVCYFPALRPDSAVALKYPETFDELMNVQEFKELRDSLYVAAKIFIESSGNPLARNGLQAGILQITPIMIRECNKIISQQGGTHKYCLEDRYDARKSIQIYRTVMERHNPGFDLLEASYIWNGGHRIALTSDSSKIGRLRAYHGRIIKRMRKIFFEMYS
jgi:hypothetical protein